METGLKGKTVLVVEAGSGLGADIARAFAAEGANLALGSLNGADAVAGLARESEGSGAKVITAACDPSDEAQVRGLVQRVVAEFGSLDVLVNNPLLPTDPLPLEQVSFDAWKRKIAVELRGPMIVCQAAIPVMRERRWGRVINFAGMAAFDGADPIASTTELGIVGLTRGLAREFGQYNITANCICPGGIESSSGEAGASYPPSPGDPIPRWGTGEEVGFLAVSLAAEDAGYITGQCLLPNGGKFFL